MTAGAVQQLHEVILEGVVSDHISFASWLAGIEAEIIADAPVLHRHLLNRIPPVDACAVAHLEYFLHQLSGVP